MKKIKSNEQNEETSNLKSEIDKLKSELDIKNKSIKELVNGLKRARKLLSCLTIREVLENGMEDEAGLNPYCINEGLASGEECVDCLWLESLIIKNK